MRYAFDKQGGFWVVDDDNRAASYSYVTSTNVDAAKKNPVKAAEKILRGMPKQHSVGFVDEIREQHYLLGVEALKGLES